MAEAANILPHERRQFFTPREVAIHNVAKDCWVSINYRVIDLTSLIHENLGPLVQPLILHAGEDISHWFDPNTGDVKYHIDSKRNISVPFLPYGPFLHVPLSDQQIAVTHVPWWCNPLYVVGRLTRKTRWIEIVNMLTHQRHSLEVCSEETLAEIQTRYLRFNAHAGSYTWKHLVDNEFVPLQMQMTLEENGIPDESLVFEHHVSHELVMDKAKSMKTFIKSMVDFIISHQQALHVVFTRKAKVPLRKDRNQEQNRNEEHSIIQVE